MAKSLVAKAKEVKQGRTVTKFSDEELDLVLAWMNDEVSISQILHALDMKGTGNIYAFLARGAREMWRKNNKV